MKISYLLVPVLLSAFVVGCLASSSESEPPSSEAEPPVGISDEELSTKVTDPLHCPRGYCEPNNRASRTRCRKGFQVNPYAICSNDGVSACCQMASMSGKSS